MEVGLKIQEIVLLQGCPIGNRPRIIYLQECLIILALESLMPPRKGFQTKNMNLIQKELNSVMFTFSSFHSV